MAPEGEAQALRALGTACLRVWGDEAPEHTESWDSQTETPGAAPGSGGDPGCVAGSGGRGESQEQGLLGLLRLRRRWDSRVPSGSVSEATSCPP